MDPAQAVGAGGAIGAVLRYLVGQTISRRDFPWHTLMVNCVGSFVLGLVVFSSIGNQLVLFVGIGICGSFTTFSTFSVQTIQLWESGDRVQSIGYAFGTLTISLFALTVAKELLTLFPG